MLNVDVCSCNSRFVVCAASEGGESAATVRDRRQPRPEGVAGQAAQLHGGARHAHHSVSHHFQKPTRPVQTLHVHKGSWGFS